MLQFALNNGRRIDGDIQTVDWEHMPELNKNEILGFAGLALLFIGIGALWFSPGVAPWMIASGPLLIAFAANVRILSPLAATLLGLYAGVTACVMAFHLIAGLADFGSNWAAHISWLFRVVGVPVALIMLGFLWYVVQERRRFYSDLPSRHPPSNLPAAAVSELVGGDAGYRTPFTVVLEMLQKGTLEIVSEGTDSLRRKAYLLRVRHGRKYEWERTVSDAIPQELTARYDLLQRLNETELGVRQQIRDYLRQGDLMNDENSVREQNVWSAVLAVHGVFLMSVGLTFWMMRLNSAWWVALGLIGVAYVVAMWIAYKQNANLNEVTDKGRTETMHWRGFGKYLQSSEFDEVREKEFEATDSLMPYSAALNRIHLWKQEPQVSLERRPSVLGTALARSWRESKVATVGGFITGAYIGSYIYPGEGIVESGVESIFGTAFSAVFGGGDSGGGSTGGGDGGGDFGGGDGGDFGISF